MLLRDIGEFGLIERISERLAVHSENVAKGIGDDAAVIRCGEGTVHVVTTDALVEGVDFLSDTIRPEQLGHKALAVNLSDLAAMAAQPEHAVVSLCVPERYTVEYLMAFYDGMRALAERFGVNILGGDLSSSPHELVVSATAMGSAREDEVCYRSGAKAGDAILLVGVVGESGAGLRLLRRRERESVQDSRALADHVMEALCKRHLEPTPLVEEGKWLGRSGKVHAMIDVSDGIGSDLARIARASGVGAVVDAASLPVTPPLRAFLDATGRDPHHYLLRAGEDFALLLTAGESAADGLMAAFRARFATPIHRVGTVVGQPGVALRGEDGSLVALRGGYDHFGAH